MQENKERMENLKDKTAKGLLWGGFGNGMQQFLGLAAGIVLGRLLSPDDYGLMAMIVVFSLIANELQNSGFKVALTNLDTPTSRDYNSVFWFNTMMGALMYVILFFSAPLIAGYYRRPELIPLCRYAFLGFVFSSFGVVQSAYLFKNLMARQQAQANIMATLVSVAVGVGTAWLGFGYWAIASQNVVYIGTNTLLLWHYSSWRPSFSIDFGPVRKMFRFSCKILLSGIFTILNNNILNVLLGRYFSAHATGVYNQAYQWHSKVFYLIQGSVQVVAQPVFVDLRSEKERQLKALRKFMRFTSFLAFPMMFGFGLVSEEFIVLTITEVWRPSAILIKYLSVSGAFVPLSFLLSNVIMSKGKSGVYMWSTICLGVIQVLLMIAIHSYGIHTMVVAYVCVTIAWFFVWHHLAGRYTGYGVLMVLSDVLPFCLSAFAVMALTYFMTSGITNLYLLLISRVVIAAALYYLVRRALRCEILNECIGFAKSRIKRKQ